MMTLAHDTNTPVSPTDNRHHVVVVGGGFAGLNCVKSLGNDPAIRVTLVDKRNHHLFQPLIYQVATGMLSPADVSSPFRYVLRYAQNVNVIMGEVTGIDTVKHAVHLTDGELQYDSLVLATGSHHHYFGKDAEWASLAPGLKSLDDALTMREKILKAFEMAEREQNPEKRKAMLTFVIVGGGPTGVELAGSIAEMVKKTMKGQFRNAHLSEALSAKAKAAMESLNIEVHTSALVTEMSETHAVIKDKEGNLNRVETRTILWGAGVGASKLGKVVADATGAETDRMGRVIVDASFNVPGHPNLYIAGDLAHYQHGETPNNMPLPGVAPAATQGGLYIAKAIKARVHHYEVPEFAYNDKGSMAIIGTNKAVASVKGAEFDGFMAWMLWLVVHVAFLVEFDNRVIVTFNWLVNYLYGKRSTRIITRTILPLFEGSEGASTKVKPETANV
jgi:NADH:ubiquinone reductase (H+-translocating)